MARSLSYDAYINSLDWKRKRVRWLASAGYMCQRCGAQNITLQVHHLHYHTLGEETDKDVQVLCIKCHEIADALRLMERRRQRWAMSEFKRKQRRGW